MLVRSFIEGVDFKIGSRPVMYMNKHPIMGESIMTADTFKTICLLAESRSGREIRSHYITMERVMKDHIRDKFLEQIALADKHQLLAERRKQISTNALALLETWTKQSLFQDTTLGSEKGAIEFHHDNHNVGCVACDALLVRLEEQTRIANDSLSVIDDHQWDAEFWEDAFVKMEENFRKTQYWTDAIEQAPRRSGDVPD